MFRLPYARLTQTLARKEPVMPRGGRRRGAGAPQGNANALTAAGNASTRGWLLREAMMAHPNVRELIRLCDIAGFFDRPLDLLRLREFVRLFYPALFDSSHPLFNQNNQKPESGWPTERPIPRFTKAEREEINEQSKIYRETGIIPPRQVQPPPPWGSGEMQ